MSDEEHAFVGDILNEFLDTLMDEVDFEHVFYNKLWTMHKHAFPADMGELLAREEGVGNSEEDKDDELEGAGGSSSSSSSEHDEFLESVLSSESTVEEMDNTPQFQVHEVLARLRQDEDVEKTRPAFEDSERIWETWSVRQAQPNNCGHHAFFNAVHGCLIAQSRSLEEAEFWGRRLLSRTSFWFTYWANMRHVGRKSMLERTHSGILERTHLDRILTLEPLVQTQLPVGCVFGLPEASKMALQEGMTAQTHLKQLEGEVNALLEKESHCFGCVVGTVNHWVALLVNKVKGEHEVVLWDSRQYWLLSREKESLQELIAEVNGRHPQWLPFQKDVFVQGLQDIGFVCRLLDSLAVGSIRLCEYCLDLEIGRLVDLLAVNVLADTWTLGLMHTQLPHLEPWSRSEVEETPEMDPSEPVMPVVDSDGLRLFVLCYTHPTSLRRGLLPRMHGLGRENLGKMAETHLRAALEQTLAKIAPEVELVKQVLGEADEVNEDEDEDALVGLQKVLFSMQEWLDGNGDGEDALQAAAEER